MNNETIGDRIAREHTREVEWHDNGKPLAAAINAAIDRERQRAEEADRQWQTLADDYRRMETRRDEWKQRAENAELDIVTLRDKLLQAERERDEARDVLGRLIDTHKALEARLAELTDAAKAVYDAVTMGEVGSPEHEDELNRRLTVLRAALEAVRAQP